jgi:hypothetical protein
MPSDRGPTVVIRRGQHAVVIIGIDAHNATHTAVAVDEVGRRLAAKTVKATSDGHLTLLEWAAAWPERSFAVEDCRHVTRRLESDMLAAGERLVRVPPQLMAAERRGGRERGKSDPIDALAVARAALREPDLPVAELDGPTRELRLLVDHRHPGPGTHPHPQPVAVASARAVTRAARPPAWAACYVESRQGRFRVGRYRGVGR